MNISKIAERKEEPKRKWVIQTVLNWILMEFTVLCVFIVVFRITDFTYLMIIGPVAGFLGYLLVKKRLENIPD